jgi:ABC-type transport system involved in multi-copper enzyme maturation permease subunit
VLVLAVGEEPDGTFANLFQGTAEVLSIFLPIVVMLAVTSEWSQRTALTTFTLVPQRERVITAKVLAGCALTIAALALCAAAAAVGNVIAGGSWSITLGQLAGLAAYDLLGMLGALALGLLLMHSALAIVTYFVLPTIVGIVVEVVRALREPSEWFDTTKSFAPLAEGSMDSGDWARLGVSVAIWVGVPLVLGLVRLRHHELK